MKLKNHFTNLALAVLLLVGNSSDAADAVTPKKSEPSIVNEVKSMNQDETMRAARLMKSSLKTWQDRVVSKQSEIDKILSDLKLDQLANEIRLKKNMLDLLELLDHEAAAIEHAFDEITPDMRHYVQALAQAPGVYAQIAANFDQFAQEADEPLFKSMYADFASHSRKLSKYYEGRAADVTAMSSQIASQMKIVRESRTFVDRVREYVKALPTDYGLETEKFSERLNIYVKTFNESVKVMSGVADRLDENRRLSR